LKRAYDRAFCNEVRGLAMAPQQLTSAHFVIHYDTATAPNSDDRAHDLYAVCEGEFNVLTDWFGIKNAFGPQDQIHVYLDKPRAGGENHGYQANGVSNMSLDPQEKNTDRANAAAIVKTIFIAELVEIFMSYNNQKTGTTTWRATDSSGEGLSILCAIERAPDGYHLISSSRVDYWLQWPALPAPTDSKGQPMGTVLPSPRQDVITTPDPTDKNWWSFGGALLFLYYLKTQLGHSVPQIIQKGGATLEETYRNLTGQTGGFNAMNTLISRFFPVGSTPKFGDFEDPFPLWDAGLRQAWLWFDPDLGTPEVTETGETQAKPFFTCPVKEYAFDIDRTPTSVLCTALTRGFGQKTYSWRVNSVDVPGSETVMAQGTVTHSDPRNGSRSLEWLALTCTVSSSPWRGTLRIEMPANLVGSVDLTVELRVADIVDSPGSPATAVDGTTVQTETIVWKPPYYEDGERCRREFERRMLPFEKVKYVNILLTLPDPPHYYDRVIQELASIPDALQALADEAPEEAAEIGRVVEERLGVDMELLGQLAKKVPVPKAVG
jgi:hypothetical protein